MRVVNAALDSDDESEDGAAFAFLLEGGGPWERRNPHRRLEIIDGTH